MLELEFDAGAAVRPPPFATVFNAFARSTFAGLTRGLLALTFVLLPFRLDMPTDDMLLDPVRELSFAKDDVEVPKDEDVEEGINVLLRGLVGLGIDGGGATTGLLAPLLGLTLTVGLILALRSPLSRPLLDSGGLYMGGLDMTLNAGGGARCLMGIGAILSSSWLGRGSATTSTGFSTGTFLASATFLSSGSP